MRAPAAFVMLVLVSLLAGPLASAPGVPSRPGESASDLGRSASGTGPTWVMVSLPSTTWAFALWFNQSGPGQLMLDASAYDDAGHSRSHVAIAPPESGTSIIARGFGEGATVTLVEDPVVSSNFSYADCAACPNRASSVTLVFILGGKSGSWTLETRWTGDAPGVSTGASVLAGRAGDFHGTRLAASLGSPLLRANVQTQMRFDTTSWLVGSFTSSAPEIAMRVQTDAGAQQCPCYFGDRDGALFGVRGEHVFWLTGAGVATDVQLIVADVGPRDAIRDYSSR